MYIFLQTFSGLSVIDSKVVSFLSLKIPISNMSNFLVKYIYKIFLFSRDCQKGKSKNLHSAENYTETFRL